MKYVSFDYKGELAEILVLSKIKFNKNFIHTKETREYVSCMTGTHVALVALGASWVGCIDLFPAIREKVDKMLDDI